MKKVVVVVGMFLAVLGLGEARADEAQVIINTVSDVDSFGFGLGVVPIGICDSGGQLPELPSGPHDPYPFDGPDDTCALTVNWTHDITEELPAGAEVLFALLVLNAAGIEPNIFPSTLKADSRQFPLYLCDQGEFGSGLIPVPLDPNDLLDGVLDVTIVKGTELNCDDQFYDVSVLFVVVDDDDPDDDPIVGRKGVDRPADE